MLMMKKLMKTGFLAALLALSACSPKTEYTNALPKNASMVVAMELDEMAGKSGLNGTSGEKAVEKLKSLIKGGLQGEAAQLAERIIGQPSESGLSFDDKVYCFATPHVGAVAILAKVADEGKLERLLEVLVKESIANPLREESGCQWTQVGSALCAFNPSTFLLMQPTKGDAMSMKGTLLSLMRQKDGEGFASLPEYQKIEAEGNDIASVVNLSAIPYEWTTRLRMGLSADIRLEDIKYFVSADFEPGRVVVNSESLIQNPKIQGFFDVMDRVMQPIGGKFLDYYPGNTMLWMGGNIQGKELYRMLRQNPAIRQVLDNPVLPVDVESIFSAVEGDVAIGCDHLASGNYLLYADVNNSRFLKTFEDIRPLLAMTGGQITLDVVGKDEYVMRTYYGTFWFGVKGNRLYVTTNPTWAEEVGRTYGASLARKPWASEVKENRLFAMAGLNGIKYAFLYPVDCVHVGMTDWRHARAEIVLKDKQANLLKQMVEMLEKL